MERPPGQHPPGRRHRGQPRKRTRRQPHHAPAHRRCRGRETPARHWSGSPGSTTSRRTRTRGSRSWCSCRDSPAPPARRTRSSPSGRWPHRPSTPARCAPFVAVIPPLMTDPPRDTECTNVPHGPRAETYLEHDLPTAVEHDLRVDPPGRELDAGRLEHRRVLRRQARSRRNPASWGSVVTFGGYFRPVTDHTTGDLFARRPAPRAGELAAVALRPPRQPGSADAADRRPPGPGGVALHRPDAPGHERQPGRLLHRLPERRAQLPQLPLVPGSEPCSGPIPASPREPSAGRRRVVALAAVRRGWWSSCSRPRPAAASCGRRTSDPRRRRAALTVVGLGDSVMAGSHCGCSGVDRAVRRGLGPPARSHRSGR